MTTNRFTITVIHEGNTGEVIFEDERDWYSWRRDYGSEEPRDELESLMECVADTVIAIVYG